MVLISIQLSCASWRKLSANSRLPASGYHVSHHDQLHPSTVTSPFTVKITPHPPKTPFSLSSWDHYTPPIGKGSQLASTPRHPLLPGPTFFLSVTMFSGKSMIVDKAARASAGEELNRHWEELCLLLFNHVPLCHGYRKSITHFSPDDTSCLGV